MARKHNLCCGPYCEYEIKKAFRIWKAFLIDIFVLQVIVLADSEILADQILNEMSVINSISERISTLILRKIFRIICIRSFCRFIFLNRLGGRLALGGISCCVLLILDLLSFEFFLRFFLFIAADEIPNQSAN